MAKQSNLEKYRSDREDQTSDRGTTIIDAAERLFVAHGIAETTMIDIASEAGVSRVTVYRYFSERDHLAYEVAGRMLGKIAAAAQSEVPDGADPLATARAGLLGLFKHFRELEHAHRFLASFDTLTPSFSRTEEVARWYRERSVQAAAFDLGPIFEQQFDGETTSRLFALLSMTMGTLGRFAVLGHAASGDQDSFDAPLLHLQDMAALYFDTTIAPAAVVHS